MQQNNVHISSECFLLPNILSFAFAVPVLPKLQQVFLVVGISRREATASSGDGFASEPLYLCTPDKTLLTRELLIRSAPKDWMDCVLFPSWAEGEASCANMRGIGRLGSARGSVSGPCQNQSGLRGEICSPEVT